MFNAYPNEPSVHFTKDETNIKQGRGKKSRSGQTTSYSDAIDSHDLVESIKEGTGTSLRNEDKTAYSKNFLDIYNGFQMQITYNII
jgi:hypothetical protein